MLYAGSVTAGDATGLRDDDGNVFEVGSTTSGTRQTSWYGRVAGVSNGVSSLTVTYRGSHSAPCEQTIYLWNWEIGYWVRFASGGGGPGETEVTFSPGASVASFVSGTSGDGEVAVRVHCTRTDSVAFKSAGDLLRVVFWRTA
jgi:hypothetical protein